VRKNLLRNTEYLSFVFNKEAFLIHGLCFVTAWGPPLCLIGMMKMSRGKAQGNHADPENLINTHDADMFLVFFFVCEGIGIIQLEMETGRQNAMSI
jgi:hypothetical protein